MSSPRRIEKTIGDGDCAFNAWVLGFCRQEVLEKIQLRDDSEFVRLASATLGVDPTWDGVKIAILALSSDKNSLQTQLAPVMRKLAVRLIAKKDHLTQPLLSAVRDYIYNNLGIQVAGRPDDIFARHSFIQKVFPGLHFQLLKDLAENKRAALLNDISEYKKLKDTERTTPEQDNKYRTIKKKVEKELDSLISCKQTSLKDWWENSGGYEQFSQEMGKPGNWAGDLELAALARYFEVSLAVQCNNGDSSYDHSIHSEHGKMPVQNTGFNLTQASINKLVSLGVVNRPEPIDDTMLTLLPLTKQELEAKILNVPDDVVAEITGIAELGNPEHTVIPNDISQPAREILKARGAIDEYDRFVVDTAKLLDLIDPIDNAERIVAVWRDHYIDSAPQLMLEHKDNHWSNVEIGAPEASSSVSNSDKAERDAKGREYETKILAAAKEGAFASVAAWEGWVARQSKEDQSQSSSTPRRQIARDQALAIELQRKELEKCGLFKPSRQSPEQVEDAKPTPQNKYGFR